MTVTGLGLVKDILSTLGVIGQAADPVSAADAQFTLDEINRVLDNWNAERGAIYAEQFDTFTLAANLSPHTIGPGPATWFASSRPESIEAASVILVTVEPILNLPITLRDAQWWALQDATQVDPIPTDLYYDPTWPAGSLFFYPTPIAVLAAPHPLHTVQLRMRILLAAIGLADVLDLPPGYRDAIRWTAAEACAPGFGVPLPPSVPALGQAARARVGAANDPPIRSLFGPRASAPRPEATS